MSQDLVNEIKRKNQLLNRAIFKARKSAQRKINQESLILVGDIQLRFYSGQSGSSLGVRTGRARNGWHVEKDCLQTSNRAFVFILYLNDVLEGGETEFLFQDESDFFKVKPQTGRLVIHPASWPYIHRGAIPVSNDKYIVTTWLNFTS